MNVLVVNGGRSSLYFIQSLAASGHDVSFLSHDRSDCEIFATTYDKPAICGDALDVNILKRSLNHTPDLVAATGDCEAENYAICTLAKKMFHVKKTIALVRNPKNIPFFLSNDVDRCFCAADLLASVTDQEAIDDNLRKYFPPENHNLVVKEIQIRPKSNVANKELWEIPLPPQSLIACVLRDGRGVIPQGNTRFIAGDRLIVLAMTNHLEETVTLLNG